MQNGNILNGMGWRVTGELLFGKERPLLEIVMISGNRFRCKVKVWMEVVSFIVLCGFCECVQKCVMVSEICLDG